MIENTRNHRLCISFALVLAILMATFPVGAQDLVPVSDITGGSSVFVFRGGSRTTKKFSTATRSKRTKAQRMETARRINRQYTTLAKNAPRREKSTVVDPNNLPPQVKTMPRDQASRLFAGVGEFYIAKDDVDHAIDFFRESVTLDGKNDKAKLGLSDALATKGNNLLLDDKGDVARGYFVESLKFNSRNAAAYFGLGEISADQDKNDEAIANYENALKFDSELTEIYMPLGILYYQKGEVAKADDLLTKALANSSETAETQVFLGVIRGSQGRDQEATRAFQRAISLDPTFSEAYYHLGDQQLRKGQKQEALKNFQKAVSLRSDYFEAWRGVGDASFELENYPTAINAYQQASKIRSDSAEIAESLGDAYRMTGAFGQAYGSYDLATLFMSRSSSYSREEQADVYSKIAFVIGRQCEINMRKFVKCEWPAAIAALEKAVQIGGGSPADHANLGWAYYNAARIDIFDKQEAASRAKLEKARINLQKAVDANPPFVEGPLLNLGMTLTDLGDYAGAISALTRVVEKEPKWLFAINELGIAYRKQNNYKEASKWFKKAIDRDDSYAVGHYNWGESEIRSGNMGNGKKAYQKLLKLGRKDLANQLVLVSAGGVTR